MNEVNWVQILASLLGGGAAGAVLTALVSTLRARKQPIGYRIEPQPVFAPLQEDSSLTAKVTICKGGTEFSFSNLFLLRVQLINKGNRDHETFSFGITLAEGDGAIFVEPREPDRHHRISVVNPVGPANPKSQLDFALTPFNRRDSYVLNIFVVGRREEALGEISIGSDRPVRFVTMPSAAELLVQATEGLSVSFGPVRFSLGPRWGK